MSNLFPLWLFCVIIFDIEKLTMTFGEYDFSLTFYLVTLWSILLNNRNGSLFLLIHNVNLLVLHVCVGD